MAIDFSNDPPPATSVKRRKQKKIEKISNNTVTMVMGMIIMLSALMLVLVISGKFAYGCFIMGAAIFLYAVLRQSLSIFISIWREVRSK